MNMRKAHTRKKQNQQRIQRIKEKVQSTQNPGCNENIFHRIQRRSEQNREKRRYKIQRTHNSTLQRDRRILFIL